MSLQHKPQIKVPFNPDVQDDTELLTFGADQESDQFQGDTAGCNFKTSQHLLQFVDTNEMENVEF